MLYGKANILKGIVAIMPCFVLPMLWIGIVCYCVQFAFEKASGWPKIQTALLVTALAIIMLTSPAIVERYLEFCGVKTHKRH
jgi:branched-subunit amino acid transport protein AzlD